MPRRASVAWRAAGITTRTCVEGGYLRHPHVLAVENFHTARGEKVVCVQISKSEGWLAEAVTGKHVSARSLNRSQLFDDLRSKYEAAESQHQTQSDLMSALGYDEEATPKTPPRKRRCRAVRTDDAKDSPPKTSRTVRTVAMRSSASAAAETVSVDVVVRGKGLYLDVRALPWLFERLREELTCGPDVDDSGSEDKDQAASLLYWDFCNDCWVARKKMSDGAVVTKRGYILRRMRSVDDALHGMTRDEAKQVVHNELVAWLADSFPASMQRNGADEGAAPAAAEGSAAEREGAA